MSMFRDLYPLGSAILVGAIICSCFLPILPAQKTSPESSGMVVSQNAIASEVGAATLRDGGNAVDAAIATAFALAVTHPAAGNLGGGGFMVCRAPDGIATTFDFREKAPGATTNSLFLDSDGKYDRKRHHDSHLAVGVPGTVAGLALAHRRLGRLPWRRLVAPAVALASNGFLMTSELSSSLERARSKFLPFPASMRAFFKPGGESYRAGEIFRQPDLARTLRRIMNAGERGFYRGVTAELLAVEMAREGGIMTIDDLAQYRALEREPVRGRYRGHRIIGMGPPSSGGITLVNMLNTLETFEIPSNVAERAHLMAETMRRGFADRARWLGDPDFNDSQTWQHLTTKKHGEQRASSIDRRLASKSRILGFSWSAESKDTTHLSVVDAERGAVSLTYTLEQSYGSGIVVPGAGFLLNNEMGDFNPRRGMTTNRGHIGSPPNLVAPGKRMLSSMCPVIVEDPQGRLRFVVGTPGGRTIINTVYQILVNCLDLELGIQEAVDRPRIHHQWFPDRITAEDSFGDEAARRVLREMGHTLSFRRSMGAAECLEVRWSGKTWKLSAGVDPRAPSGGAARSSSR